MLLHVRVGFSKNTNGLIQILWILLDNCSNSSVYNNEAMIGNIHGCTSDETLTVYTNGESKTFAQISPFKFLPMELHFNPDPMNNTVAIKGVASIPGVHISKDSRKERAIMV